MLEEIKKEFEKRFCKHNQISPYDWNHWEADYNVPIDVSAKMVWQFIEQKLTEVIGGYETTLAEVSKVYDNLTNSKLSKPNYEADVVIDEVRTIQEIEIAEAVKQAKIEENEMSKNFSIGLAKFQDQVCYEDFNNRINELKGDE